MNNKQWAVAHLVGTLASGVHVALSFTPILGIHHAVLGGFFLYLNLYELIRHIKEIRR